MLFRRGQILKLKNGDIIEVTACSDEMEKVFYYKDKEAPILYTEPYSGFNFNAKYNKKYEIIRLNNIKKKRNKSINEILKQ